MQFEAVITLGNLITLMGMGLFCIAFVWGMRGDIAVTREQIKAIDAILATHVSRFLADDVRESQRFDRIEEEVKNLAVMTAALSARTKCKVSKNERRTKAEG
jgi:hypothetical protein